MMLDNGAGGTLLSEAHARKLMIIMHDRRYEYPPEVQAMRGHMRADEDFRWHVDDLTNKTVRVVF